MAKAETVEVSKPNEAGDVQIARPLKSDLEKWLGQGWTLVEQPKPVKGDSK